MLLFGQNLYSQEQIIIQMCKDTDKPTKGLIVAPNIPRYPEIESDNYLNYVYLDLSSYTLFKAYILQSDLKRNCVNKYFNECHLINVIVIGERTRSYKITNPKRSQRFLISFIDLSKRHSFNESMIKSFEAMLISIIGYDNFKELYFVE